MATRKQIDANRRNAQKSTGPTTPEGKQHSSRNALQSGISAESEIIIGERPDDLARLRDEYLQHYRPDSPVARDLVDSLVRSAWLRRRFALIEADLFNSRYDDLIEPDVHRAFRFGNYYKRFNLLERRINSVDRAFHRSLKALKEIQSLQPPPDQTAPEKLASSLEKPVHPAAHPEAAPPAPVPSAPSLVPGQTLDAASPSANLASFCEIANEGCPPPVAERTERREAI